MSQDSVIVYNLTGYKLKYFHYKHMKIYIYCPKYSRNELVSYIYIYIFFVVFTCSIVKRKFRHRLRAQQDGEESLRKTFIYLFIYGQRREMVSSQDLCFPSSFPAKKLEMLEYILGDFLLLSWNSSRDMIYEHIITSLVFVLFSQKAVSQKLIFLWDTGIRWVNLFRSWLIKYL